jgi:putative membrane protein
MKQTIQGFMLAGALVLGSTALAQQAGKENKKGTAELRGFVVPTDEKALFERLHYTNQLEIKLGQLAQQNSNNPDVKAFGKQMVDEHTAADQKLMTLAQGRGMKLADMPKPMNDMEKKMMAADKAVMEELQTLKGEPFDSCYIANQVGDHDATLGKLMAGRQAVTANAEATSLMEEMTQHVSQHRQQAYSVLGKLGQSMMGVGGGGTGMQKGTDAGGHGGHMGTGTGSGATGTGTGGHMGTGTGSGTTGGTTGTGQSGSGMQQPKK